MGPPCRSGVPAGADCALIGLICAVALGVSLRSSASVGNRALPVSPDTIDGRNWKLLIWLSLSSGEVGFGPFGFGPTPRPFAAIQTSRSRLFDAPAKTGYEAVGTRPISWNALTFGCAAAARTASFGSPGRSSPWPPPEFLRGGFLPLLGLPR